MHYLSGLFSLFNVQYYHHEKSYFKSKSLGLSKQPQMRTYFRILVENLFQNAGCDPFLEPQVSSCFRLPNVVLF